MAAVPSIGRADRPAVAPREAELTRALYERHATQIFRYCLHQLGSREEAEDAVQSTFLNAFRGIKRGIVPERESAWLFKIAENVCMSRRRSSWRRGRVESPTDFDLVEEHASAPTRLSDELLGLEDVLAQMPEGQRRAILLREWQGLSYREIAEELRLSQTAVETLIFRARRSLAKGLEAPPAPVRKRRMVRGSDLGNILTALKSFLIGGGAATAKVVAVVAVVGAGTVVGSSPVHKHHASVPVNKPAAHAPAPVAHATHVAVMTPPAPAKPRQRRHTTVAPRASASHTPFVAAGTTPTVATDAPAAPASPPQPAAAPPAPAPHTTAPAVTQPPPPSGTSTGVLPPPDQSGYGNGTASGSGGGQGQGNGQDRGQGGSAPTQGSTAPPTTAPPTGQSPSAPAPPPASPGNGHVGQPIGYGSDGQPSDNGSGSSSSGNANGHGGGGYQSGSAGPHGHGH
jgi:RNA polymerase sigma factor (sigma-70 family)